MFVTLLNICQFISFPYCFIFVFPFLLFLTSGHITPCLTRMLLTSVVTKIFVQVWLQGKLETSHMASHINTVHGGQRDRAKFVMKKVKTQELSFIFPQNRGRVYVHQVQVRGEGNCGHKPKIWRQYLLPLLSVYTMIQQQMTEVNLERWTIQY